MYNITVKQKQRKNKLMDDKTFTYSYSAKLNKEAQDIRKKYLPKEERGIDKLKKLDALVQMAGVIEGLTIGIIGCLVFGIGMCFGLDVFSGADWLSLIFGALGIIIMIPAYPVYKRVREKSKKSLTPVILKLSDEIINSHV